MLTDRRSRNRHVMLPLTMLVLAVGSMTASAADHDLDLSWAGLGYTTAGDPGTLNGGQGMAIQCDGKVVVTGWVNGGGEDAELAVVRFNPDGSLDASFASNGVFRFDPNDLYFDGGSDVVIQKDGKIVVAGTTIAGLGSWDFLVMRLNPNGSFDPTFSGDGWHTFEFGAASRAYGVALQDDGRIVVVGQTNNTSAMAIARLTTGGTLDPTFDGDGMKTIDFTLGNDEARDVAIYKDGRIVVVGTVGLSGGSVVAVVRMLSNGTLDSGFGIGGGGAAALDFGIYSEGQGIALQEDGRIVVTGSTDLLTSVAVGRLTTGGLPDPTFGGDGLVTHDFGLGADIGWDVEIAHDGKIVVGGSIFDGVEDRTGVTRFLADGSLDTPFGNHGNGTWVDQALPTQSTAQALSIQPHDGRLLIAGIATWNLAERMIYTIRLIGDSSLIFAGNFECGDTSAWN